METFIIDYFDDKTHCKGYLVRPKSTEKLPIILISPTWLGLNHFIIEKANQIANLGYIAFAIDVFGEGKTTTDTDEAAKLIAPFFLDRAALRRRMQAAYNQAKKFPEADPDKIGAIGFCFGGLTLVELLRSGALFHGASFHGVLTDTLEGKKATLAPSEINPASSFLLLHGYKDPLVPITDVVNLQKELSEANIDWQTHIFGSAGHAFTNPELADKDADSSTKFCFDPLANARSFQIMTSYFKEKFS